MGPKLFATPPPCLSSRQGKTFCLPHPPTPPLRFERWNLFVPLFSMSKTSINHVKTTQNVLCPFFRMAKTFSIPPFCRGKTSLVPLPPTICNTIPVINDWSLIIWQTTNILERMVLKQLLVVGHSIKRTSLYD